MPVLSRTKNGWGNISDYIGRNPGDDPPGPSNIRIVIPGNDIKRVFSVSAGYIQSRFEQDYDGETLTAGMLLIFEGVLDEEMHVSIDAPISDTFMTTLHGAKVLFACSVSGKEPFHATFSDSRAVESSSSDAITILLTYCPRTDDLTTSIASYCNAFLNAFGVNDVPNLGDVSQDWKIR